MVVVSSLVHYDTLLQNATNNITTCKRYFITKYEKMLLQNASAFSVQNVTVITKCTVKYNVYRLYNLQARPEYHTSSGALPIIYSGQSRFFEISELRLTHQKNVL